tara:strand:- start:3021 stop:3791 length:771 start_codon:yes stop_codon:yes gene_type:complete
MSKKTIIIFSCVIIIASILFAVWYFFELPMNNKTNKNANLTISAVDRKIQDIKINTKYIIKGKNFDYLKSGETLKEGYVLENLPSNQTYIIYNENIKNQTYYRMEKEIIINEYKTYQIKILLNKPGKVFIFHEGEFGIDKNLTLILNSTDYYQKPIICMKWSLHIVKIDLNISEESYENIQQSNYPNYDKCIVLKESLNKGSKFQIPINYLQWGLLDEKDHIKFLIMDSEFINGEYITQIDNNDIGEENKEYIIDF